jgi:rhodanese-related sulfurtransferase
MINKVERDEVRGLIASGAQLVEVLPFKEYEEQHLPGAISIPLKRMSRESVDQLDRDRPVIVYCYDYQ